MKIVRLLGLVLCAALVAPSAPLALADTFVVPHVLEKSKTPSSVGIKEEGVKSVKAPRDVATGQSSGKRQHKPLKANLNSSKSNKASLNSSKSNKTIKPKKQKVKSKSNITNNRAAKGKPTKEQKITSPRDRATGQASGKKAAKPTPQATNLNSSRSN
ncbi:MAG: hypothetical protein Q7S47_01030 [bacterium]|nr:hypothetical protein [bacterium]